jgi:hypothetical protein
MHGEGANLTTSQSDITPLDIDRVLILRSLSGSRVSPFRAQVGVSIKKSLHGRRSRGERHGGRQEQGEHELHCSFPDAAVSPSCCCALADSSHLQNLYELLGTYSGAPADANFLLMFIHQAIPRTRILTANLSHLPRPLTSQLLELASAKLHRNRQPNHWQM